MCPTRLPREHRKITRSNTKATSDLRSKEDQQIMQSMTIRPKHGISVRSPQAPGPRSRSALAAGEGATTLGDHPFSLITCVRVSCASNAGKLEVGSHSWRSLFAPACPGNGFSLREPGYWYTVFFRPHRGVSGTIEAGWGHWGQTRFGHARSERSRPQFTAHNSVRSLKNGLSLGGSSATRLRVLVLT